MKIHGSARRLFEQWSGHLRASKATSPVSSRAAQQDRIAAVVQPRRAPYPKSEMI